jgi:hypothetical protein
MASSGPFLRLLETCLLRRLSFLLPLLLVMGCSKEDPFKPPGGDTAAPTTPGSFTAVAGSHGFVTLNWTPSTDNVGVTGYLVQGGAFTDTTTQISYTTAAPLWVTTNWTVSAFDAAGNVSAPTESIQVYAKADLLDVVGYWQGRLYMQSPVDHGADAADGLILFRIAPDSTIVGLYSVPLATADPWNLGAYDVSSPEQQDFVGLIGKWTAGPDLELTSLFGKHAPSPYQDTRSGSLNLSQTLINTMGGQFELQGTRFNVFPLRPESDASGSGGVVAIWTNLSGSACHVSQSTIDFGSVAVGNYVDKALTITNIGAGLLTGTLSSGGPFQFLGNPSYNLDFAESATFTIRFTPTVATSLYTMRVTDTGCGEIQLIGRSQ